jgi:hypothetical protein
VGDLGAGDPGALDLGALDPGALDLGAGEDAARDVAVLRELVALEPVFHAPGMTRARFEEMTAPDFVEVGASGRRYDREHVWSVLAARFATGEAEPPFGLLDPVVRRLGPDTWLLTYVLDLAGRVTRRATVWERAEGHWRVVYHQGTVAAGAAPV